MSRTLRRLAFGLNPSCNQFKHRFYPEDLLDPDMAEFIHREIYRNGSSHRQRRKGIAMTKRLDGSRDRLRLKADLRGLWFEY